MDHIQSLQRDPFMMRAKIIFVPERNMAHESGHIWKHIAFMPNVTTVYQKGPDMNPGIWTDRRRKVEYALAMRDMIRTGTCKIYHRIHSANRYCEPDHRQGTFQRMVEQIRTYKQVDTETIDPNSLMRTGVSGVVDKYGKRNASARDDMAFTFSMCMGACDMLEQERMPGFDSSFLE